MKNLLLQSEDFTKVYSINEINTMAPGVYHINQDGKIKHHHDILITEDQEIYYVASFAVSVDSEILEEIESYLDYGFIHAKRIERHPSTWSTYQKYSK